MADQQALEELARSRTREALRTESFLSLEMSEQKALFQDMYKKNYQDLLNSTGLSNAASSQPGTSTALAGPSFQDASKMIDDDRHLNQRIDQAGDIGADFINQIDFPGFVSDLLKGVFDANLDVTLQQMETYQTLLQTATESVSKFVNAIDDTAAFGYLAENSGDEFSIDFSDGASDDEGNPAATLTDTSGEPVDIGDNQVKARIMDAKIAMAKEQRALLRETILMGITRLVIEKGNVKASVLFDIKATEEVTKKDRAASKDSYSSGRGGNASGGLVGKILGFGSFGGSRSRRKSKVSISSVDSKATTELQAKVAGSVDITFKSDYFKLDNFATMYGPESGGTGGAAPGGQNEGGSSGG